MDRENASLRPVRRAGLDTFVLQDEAVVYDLARDTVHYLNRTARLVWDRCDGVRSVQAIERELFACFRDAEDASIDEAMTVERGIADTIQMLMRDGLLSIEFDDCR